MEEDDHPHASGRKGKAIQSRKRQRSDADLKDPEPCAAAAAAATQGAGLPPPSNTTPISTRNNHSNSNEAADAAAATSTTAAIPVLYVKKILREGEPNLGYLLQPATELIAACSELYLRQLVQKCRTSRRDSPPEDRLQQRLRQVVQEETLLAGVLDELLVDDVESSAGVDNQNHQTGSGTSRSSLLTSSEWTCKKRKAPASLSASSEPSHKKSVSTAKAKDKDEIMQNALQIAGDTKVSYMAPMNRRQEVVLDEEDYD